MMIISKTTKYSKKEKKFLSKRPELKNKYHQVLRILKNDYNDKRLNLHKIYTNPPVYSIKLTYSYRIILDFIIVNNEILLIDIGNHDEVYK